VELGLFRIIGALLDCRIEEGHRLGDRVVVADRAVAAQDLLDEFLAVDRQLQRGADVAVVLGAHDAHYPSNDPAR